LVLGVREVLWYFSEYWLVEKWRIGIFWGISLLLYIMNGSVMDITVITDLLMNEMMR